MHPGTLGYFDVSRYIPGYYDVSRYIPGYDAVPGNTPGYIPGYYDVSRYIPGYDAVPGNTPGSLPGYHDVSSYISGYDYVPGCTPRYLPGYGDLTRYIPGYDKHDQVRCPGMYPIVSWYTLRDTSLLDCMRAQHQKRGVVVVLGCVLAERAIDGRFELLFYSGRDGRLNVQQQGEREAADARITA